MGYLLTSLGLVLDIIGFIGIFFLKPYKFTAIPPLVISRFMGGNDSNHIEESVNDAFDKFNETQKKNAKSSFKYFIVVLIGFSLQFVGLILSCISFCSV